MPTSEIDALLARAAAGAGHALGGTVHLHCTDVEGDEGEWLLGDGPGGTLSVRREHAKGDVAARGPAADLLALLSGNVTPDGVTIFGDAAVLGRLVERVRPTS